MYIHILWIVLKFPNVQKQFVKIVLNHIPVIMCVNREYVQNSLCGDNSLSGCYGVKFLSHCKTSSTKPQTIGFITLNIINQISKKKKI